MITLYEVILFTGRWKWFKLHKFNYVDGRSKYSGVGIIILGIGISLVKEVVL